MPPRSKIDKKSIMEAAIALIRENGWESLNARAVAARLGCSTQPVFSNYRSMEDLKNDAVRRAGELYNENLRAALADQVYPPYKAAGMNYISFAQNEPALFRLLFMRNRSGEPSTEAETYPGLLRLASEAAGISEESAQKMHLEIWAFVHGLAVMTVTSYAKFDTETISGMLTDAYLGLKHIYNEKEHL